ncbi:hypothetical protein [Rugamonas aquatica]|uniref:Uncharacterized protein n=1 Tax=Rugamonas aquatica TaxID=2743357 RepID=A0A6A7N2D3_9BURK|nr:hypothetical protein [Rugamonas aquatica]MQA39152.1 hypothetical protein [Rugamonas aquatica]
MAFTLEVQSDVRPANLPSIWVQALAQHGIAIEFPPNFLSECETGVLIMKVLAAPAALTREDVNEPASAYFEFWTDEDGFGFSTASGRSTVDFAVQCLCAATLADHLDAVYIDPQMGKSARGADALSLAMEEIKYFISTPDEEVYRKFVDWNTL